MSNFRKLVPENIRTLTSYKPGKPARVAEQESGVRCIKMASNENPFGPSPKALEAIQRVAASVNVYPEPDAPDLKQRLAEHYKIGAEHILVTDGSTPCLDLIARALLRPGLNAVTSECSFIVYPIVTQAAGAQLIRVPMRDYRFDLDGIARAINQDTRLVFIANPNNPTGTLFDADAADAFLARVPEDVTVVLDEAYHDFAQFFAARDGYRYTHSLDYVREGRNVIVLRTFSKGHGLAGLRIGYAFGPPELLRYLAQLRMPFSISAVAEAAALAAFEDGAHMRRTLENNAEQAAFLQQELARLGLSVVPTTTNFLYVDAGEDSVDLAKRLQSAGVIIRPLRSWGAPTAIRVTIGRPEDNRKFLAAVKKSLTAATVR